MNQFIISDQQANERLDKFISAQLPDISRSQIQKLITNGSITVNDQLSKVHRFLKTGDRVDIKTTEVYTEDKEMVIEKPIILEPKIVFENDDYLIIEKPAGLLVHPTDRQEPNTLVHWLVAKYPTIKNVGEDTKRSGIVHRLDRDVSGLMVVAKNQLTFNHLKEQFQERKTKKQYHAVVYGRLTKDNDEIIMSIGRNKDGQFVSHPLLEDGSVREGDKFAKTLYSVLEYIQDFSVVDVTIVTGRTHQIRTHFSAIGHPIVGDPIYRPRKPFLNILRRKIKVINPGRIFLHAKSLGFFDQTAQWQEYHSAIPTEITNFINDRKKS